MRIGKSVEDEELENEEKEDIPPKPKRERTTKASKKKDQETSKDEIDPPVVEVESSREKTKVYSRNSRTPSPKETLQNADPLPMASMVEQPKATSPSPSVPKQVTPKEHETSGEAEPFKEGELFGVVAELETEDVEMHLSPLMQYENSPVSSKGNRSPEKENVPIKTPSPLQEEEPELGNQGDRSPEKEKE